MTADGGRLYTAISEKRFFQRTAVLMLATNNLELFVFMHLVHLELATQNFQLGSLATNNLELATVIKKGR